MSQIQTFRVKVAGLLLLVAVWLFPRTCLMENDYQHDACEAVFLIRKCDSVKGRLQISLS